MIKRIKNITILLILFLTILLNIVEKFLLNQNIEYTNRMVIIKIVFTWFISPFFIVKLYNDFVIQHIDNADVVNVISISASLYMLIIVFIFVLRILFFVLFEDKIETLLSNGLIMVRHENFGSQDIVYYDPINYFLYRRIVTK